ncbi:MAG: 50S ribosomal protein L24 [Planctomycetota bacterium]
MHVKKGDKVVVISGSFKSTTPHEVIDVNRAASTVTLKDVNVRLKNLKRTKDAPKGGQIRKEFPIHASKVQLWDAESKNGSRVRMQSKGRSKVRVFVKSGKTVG